eukprot:c26553_g1_i1 orf=411-1979(-)
MSPLPEQDCLDKMTVNGGSGSCLIDSLTEKAIESWVCTPNTAQQSVGAFTGVEDPWFMKQSCLDSSILKQALQQQSKAKQESYSSSENVSTSSVVENFNRCMSTNAYGNMGTAFYQVDCNSAVARALQSGLFHQSVDSNIGSPISSSDRVSQPGSPFNNSCASNKRSRTGDDIGDSVSKLSVENGRFPIHVSTAIPEDSDLAFAKRGVRESATQSSWTRTISESQNALSAQASVRAGTTKVSKRRSRASSKPPITVLSADTSNFRAMVQKLTGIPTSPPMQPRRYHFWDTPTASSILKPHATRPTQSIPGLPTLDTSAFFLLDGASTLNQNAARLQRDSLLQGFPQVRDNSVNGSLEGYLGLNHGGQLNPYNSLSVSNADMKTLFPSLSDTFKHPNDPCVSLPMLSDPSEGGSFTALDDRMREKCFVESLLVPSVRERLSNQLHGRGECSVEQSNCNTDLNHAMSGGKSDTQQFILRQTANLESFLMGNDNFDYPTRTAHGVDTWLSCDGLHAPITELAHGA